MNDGDFIDECLLEHNNKRKLHNVEPLRHCRALDNTAQEWAEYLITKDNLQNSPLSNRGEIGESISLRSSTGPNVEIKGFEVTSQWYSDIKNYDFATGKGPAGNFTQLVWSNTKEVGFGRAKLGNKCIIVAHYRPAGNIRGRYMENVFPSAESMTASGYNSYTRPSTDPQTVDSQLLKEINKDVSALKNIGYSRPEDKNNKDDYSGSDSEFEFSSFDKDCLQAFVRQIIKSHNVFRKKHSSPKIKHSRKLSELAQQWADQLIKESVLSNSGYVYNGWRLGENIVSRWSNNLASLNPEEIIEQWYSENAKFKYNQEPESIQGIGNFTQMIWKSSKLIGIGRATQVSGITCTREKDETLGKESTSEYLPGCNSSRTIVVCFYYPPGNVASSFLENVLPPETLNLEPSAFDAKEKTVY